MNPASQNVIVTGASRGLGLAIARKLSDAGYRVIALAREKRQPLVEAIAQADHSKGGALFFVPFDLHKIEEIPDFVRALRKEFGPIYGLVNNAAIGLTRSLAIMHNSEIEELVRVNMLAPILLTKYVVRSMLSAGSGRIVNVASIAGSTGSSGLSVYAATKSSMVGFTRSLAREVGRQGICVNAVAPGFMDTEMTDGLEKEQRLQIMRRSALRRFIDVVDVANAVEYLLGDKGRSISGIVLTVDAGASA